jgi:hypothetical protein
MGGTTKTSDPLAGVSAALRQVRTLYRRGRTCFQEVGCDFVAKIPVTIRSSNNTRQARDFQLNQNVWSQMLNPRALCLSKAT